MPFLVSKSTTHHLSIQCMNNFREGPGENKSLDIKETQERKQRQPEDKFYKNSVDIRAPYFYS